MRITAILTAAALCLALPGLIEPSAVRADHHDEHDTVKRAICVLKPTEGNKAHGVIKFQQGDGFVQIAGIVEGIEPGEHGFHIHEFGDLSVADGSAAGGHYNPGGHKHGGPDDEERHAGDLGNITGDARGVANVMMKVEGLKLRDIVGRSIVVHEKPDDLKSQPSGDSGPRIAVGVIGIQPDKQADQVTPATPASP
jgi:superoxide dismutase, Cu-Zn family